MLTQFDKAIVAVLIPLIVLANQKWGLTLPIDPDTLGALIAGLTGLGVYFIPNKGT